MFGLWFSIIGLFFGLLCSGKAKEMNRSYKDWFTLGFIFSVPAFISLLFLSDLEQKEKMNEITIENVFGSTTQ